MRILFILDPIEKLDFNWDNSLFLLAELSRRGHETWAVNLAGLKSYQNKVMVRGRILKLRKALPPPPTLKQTDFQISSYQNIALRRFDLVLIRKEPPFDERYVHLTQILELEAHHVPMVNHPAGIRDANEKLSCLLFPKWIPPTVVTHLTEEILAFKRRLKSSIVVKPLDFKGGKDVHLMKSIRHQERKILHRMTRNGNRFVMAQEFIPLPKGQFEKRILILDGTFLAAYEKRPEAGEFRANLGLGGSFHPTQLTRSEKNLLKKIKPYLLQKGLFFVGIDVRAEKLLEINVTSPAGIVEATILYPKLRPVGVWADSLEAYSRSFSKRRPRV